MRRNLKTYVDLESCDNFCMAIVDSCLNRAIKDGITELLMSKDDYEIILRFMVACGHWNWDRKSFMGIHFIVQ